MSNTKKGAQLQAFKFKQKQIRTEAKKDKNIGDFFNRMTDSQRLKFGSKLAYDERVQSEYSHLIGTGNYEQFGQLLAEMLAEKRHFEMFFPLLVEHGFNV